MASRWGRESPTPSQLSHVIRLPKPVPCVLVYTNFLSLTYELSVSQTSLLNSMPSFRAHSPSSSFSLSELSLCPAILPPWVLLAHSILCQPLPHLKPQFAIQLLSSCNWMIANETKIYFSLHYEKNCPKQTILDGIFERFKTMIK